MKKRILGFLSLPLFFLVGCTNKDVALSGTITTKEVEIEDVSSLEVYNINLKSGFSSFGPKIVCLNDDSKKKRAVITASSDLIEKVSIKESGATLKISASSHERYLTDSCEIYLYNCVFNSINLASATQMIANELALNEIDVELSGASSFKASKIELNDASFDLSGASSGYFSFRGSLKLDLSGASNLYYLGDSSSLDVSTSGGSSVKKYN